MFDAGSTTTANRSPDTSTTWRRCAAPTSSGSPVVLCVWADGDRWPFRPRRQARWVMAPPRSAQSPGPELAAISPPPDHGLRRSTVSHRHPVGRRPDSPSVPRATAAILRRRSPLFRTTISIGPRRQQHLRREYRRTWSKEPVPAPLGEDAAGEAASSRWRHRFHGLGQRATLWGCRGLPGRRRPPRSPWNANCPGWIGAGAAQAGRAGTEEARPCAGEPGESLFLLDGAVTVDVDGRESSGQVGPGAPGARLYENGRQPPR